MRLIKVQILDGSVPANAAGMFEFHVSRRARDKYQFDEVIFTSSGNVIFANLHAARLFAQKMNDKRDLIKHPDQAVKAGQINALGLIDEILHYVIARYRQQLKPKIFEHALNWLEAKVGAGKVESTLQRFVEEFPPAVVYKNDMDIRAYLNATTKGIPNRQIVLEEMLMLWLANMNPAFSFFLELFDDEVLKRHTAYLAVIQSLREFFETQPRFGPDKQTLIDMLRTPALANPHSLQGQLQFVRRKWGLLLDDFLLRLDRSLDLIREEIKPAFWGPGPSKVLEYAERGDEPEQFSQDLDWMPRLVLIAKSTLVWLDQLSKKYQRSIKRLDEIPDAELDTLARWGFTGLWLIGVWERSPASKKIKQMCGNPDAEASAYSLFDYEVSHELGGYHALLNLRERCWSRGIRLASDMVPNHTGIDSKWVREHPDWFISTPESPFPSYSFTGPNYSGDPRYGIFIEDKYYERTDAAVVFKREDYWTGDVRYIYHGNDGTSMPWNDTAQLNYLNPEVREAIIQTILHVARMFPIIRFDAAMTLTKRHFHRLWFPEPGHGGDIPSRAEHGLAMTAFNHAMPNEFWREVVDRVAQEAPDTLLLAEAFWLMEGYFVRSLGMHRVYNSAFMNMLKNEENEKYRSTIKNTIRFNPEILKRYVNFMSNPDEETAVLQFGKNDKYFGACVMMVTMPGLPMLGHGQVEGFREKYGMEYRRAYLDEQVDWDLVHRHEREIFPLLKKRYLFAEVENFLLYDFFVPEGQVNENVHAYSNRFGEERALVVYNNKFEHTRGWIRFSTAFAVKTGRDGETRLIQKSLGQGLAIYNNEDYFCLFRDYISGLEYIRNCRALCEQGLYIELGAYKYHVFMDFQQVRDDERRRYARLAEYLDGRGVPSLSEQLTELSLKPLLDAFDRLWNEDMLKKVTSNRITSDNKTLDKSFLTEFEDKYSELLKQAKEFSSGTGKEASLAKAARRKLEAILQLDTVDKRFPLPKSRKYQSAMRYLRGQWPEDTFFESVSYAWLIVHELGKIANEPQYAEQSRSWLDEWLLGKRLANLLLVVGGGDEQSRQEGKLLVHILTKHQNWHLDQKPKKHREHRILSSLLRSRGIQEFLKVNRFDNILWFNKENFEKLVWWLFRISVVQRTFQANGAKDMIAREICDKYGLIQKWLKAEQKSEYKLEKLLELLKGKMYFVKEEVKSSNQKNLRSRLDLEPRIKKV